jgi:hypothetical protein
VSLPSIVVGLMSYASHVTCEGSVNALSREGSTSYSSGATRILTGKFSRLGLVRLIPLPMDWMGLEKIKKEFDLIGI